MRFFIAIALLLAATMGFAGQQPQPKKDMKMPPPIKHDLLDQFKKLAGEWVGVQKEGHMPGEKCSAVYKVTSNGSAVVETLAPGTPMEMVTVIHPDGKDLILTHYCALGNQPQMKATAMDGNKIAFKFVRATNLKSDKDMCMHDVTFTFIDADTLRTEWVSYADGKAVGKGVFELKRKK